MNRQKKEKRERTRKPSASANSRPSLRLEWRSPTELAENPANWRRHPEAQVSALADVIAEVGWAGACLFNERTKRLIDGHARREVAIKQGAKRVPVLVGNWTEEQERKILATLDPLSALAEADPEALAALLAVIDFESESVAAMLLGMKSDAGLATVEPGAGGDEFDATPEATGPTRTKAGELWVIGGKHRLLVGDCTDAGNVARLMDGAKAGLCNTDPPYGVKLDLTANHDASNSAKGITTKYRDFGAIENDELDGPELQAFLESYIRTAVPHLTENAAHYMWHPMLTQGTFFAAAAAAAAADILIHRQIVWVKPHFIFGRGDYHWQHELCFYGWRRGYRPEFYGERNQSTTWVLDEGGGAIRKDQGHPTQKPIELFSRPIQNHTKPGEVIYEPFAGSGSQFIAAHRLGRVCYGCEIEPRYADVILKRAEAEGLEAHRSK